MSGAASRRVFLAAMPVAALGGSASDRVRIVHSRGEKVAFFHGKRLLFEYRYAAVRPKPYVHPFCAPDGAPLTLDGPKDHVHHRGVMLAWSDVRGFDFWGEDNPGPPHGKIVHQRFDVLRDRPVAELSAVNHWTGDGVVFVVERRTIRAPVPSSDITWLEWESELTAADGPVTLSAKGHPYDGLGIRFVAGMDGGRVLNANGSTEIAKANGEPAAWCAYLGAAGAVAVFDHFSNPRHPSPFFVMNQPFGYLSAAPTFREPFELRAGEVLRLRYAVLGFLGAPDRLSLDRLCQSWSKRPWRKS
jgi:hypothetical protein